MNRPPKLQRLYQILSSRKLDTTKNRGVTRWYTKIEGGFIFARNTAGESPASFGTDWTVRFARPSAVRKRRPYPLSGCPASLLKIVAGKSTLAPVSGTSYFCHPSFEPLPGQEWPAGKSPSTSSATPNTLQCR